jgi:hypothetical protein
MAENENDDTFVLDAEDVDGRLTAVLYYRCPECGTSTRFTAQDEKLDGTLVCPGPECDSLIRLEGDGLKGGQRKLDEAEDALSDGFDKL